MAALDFELVNGVPEPWDDMQKWPRGVDAPSQCGLIAGDPDEGTRPPFANVLSEGAGGFQLGKESPEAKKGGLFRKQFRKTRLCRYHIGGCCWNGGGCRFAHSSHELQGGPDLAKTSMCTAWMKGSCPFEARDCPYAHGPKELRCTPLYLKTAMCKDFMAGTCIFGESCRYAHGAHELKKTTDSEAPQFASNLEEASTKGKQVGAVATSATETSTATPGSSVRGDGVNRRSSDACAHCPKLRYATFSRSIYAPMFSNTDFEGSWTGSQTVVDLHSCRSQDEFQKFEGARLMCEQEILMIEP